MSVKRLRKSITTNWRVILVYTGLFAILAAALCWRLETIVPGYSPAELQSYATSQNLKTLLDYPFNAPFMVLVKMLSYFHSDSLLVTRWASVGCGMLVLAVFAATLRHWYSHGTAILGTLLFGLSAWFLHVARSGTPDILFFGLFLLAAAGFWLKRTAHWLPLAVCFMLATILLYVPGMIWFIIFGAIWQWRTIDVLFKKHLLAVSLASILALAALAPLGWALYKHHDLIMPLLGMPEHLPAPLVIVENILRVPFHLFIRNEANPAMWLGTAPILDVFSLVMVFLGGYMYLRHGHLVRAPIFLAIALTMSGLVALGGSVTFSVIMPFLYLVIAAGLSYLLHQWFRTFPRNPIARSIAWSSVCIIVGLACSYHIIHYFVGWPHTTATHEIFTIQKP